jgi:hypothetical protein
MRSITHLILMILSDNLRVLPSKLIENAFRQYLRIEFIQKMIIKLVNRFYTQK